MKLVCRWCGEERDFNPDEEWFKERFTKLGIRSYCNKFQKVGYLVPLNMPVFKLKTPKKSAKNFKKSHE